ncbi:MAG TPA: diacylglycerol kinase family protein [Candidatus Dormibacteraeota bacterium]|nr:diacylglycerol kinase family protein [Candidatus Dormibacteraeota bacterium]
MTPHTLVVVNPASAGGRTGRHWAEVATLMLDAGLDFETYRTTAPGDATRAVRAALREGRTRVVAVGGDGTLNEVVDGFFAEDGTRLAPDAVLGLVPSGTGGDFRKAAGVPADSREAVRLLASGQTRRIDAGRIDFDSGARRHFINIADCGLGGEVVARVNRSRFKGGGARGTAVFLWQSLAALWTFGAHPVTVRVDTERFDGAVQSVVVANGRYFGGGMHIAPDAALDDGLFDVVIVEARGRVRSLRGLPSLYRGRHLGEPGVSVLRGATVRIETPGAPLLFDVEGEQIGATPATLTCLAGAIRVCAPAASDAV